MPSMRIWVPPPACGEEMLYSVSSYIKYTVLLKPFTLPFKALSKVRLTSPSAPCFSCSSDLLKEVVVSTLCLAGWEILPSSQSREPLSWQESAPFVPS